MVKWRKQNPKYLKSEDSDNKDAESEKGTTVKMTDKAAKEMVNKIHAPIDKARSVKDPPADRLNELYGN